MMMRYLDITVIILVIFQIKDTVNGDCGGSFTGQSGLIATPNFPGFYSSSENITCEWTINVNGGNTISLISTRDLHLYTDLEVRDGSGPSAPLLWQSVRGKSVNVTSSRSQMYVRLYDKMLSSPYNLIFPTTSRFSAAWTVVEVTSDCGGLNIAERGILYSPGYPDYCVGFIQCEWRITVQRLLRITLTSTELSIESYSGDHRCDRGEIEVRDAKSQQTSFQRNYCEDEAIDLETSSHTIIVKFETTSKALFKIEWRSVRLNEDSCGGKHDTGASTGLLTSPNYPMRYKDGHLCRWTVTVNPGYTVHLNFIAMDVESGTKNSCSYDEIEVRDGTGGELLGSYCGSVIPAPVASSGNTIYVTFESDSSISMRGFVMLWQANSYEKARSKLKQAEVTSDIQTEAEDDIGQTKRKKIPNRRFDSSESEEEAPLRPKSHVSSKKSSQLRDIPDSDDEETQRIENIVRRKSPRKSASAGQFPPVPRLPSPIPNRGASPTTPKTTNTTPSLFGNVAKPKVSAIDTKVLTLLTELKAQVKVNTQYLQAINKKLESVDGAGVGGGDTDLPENISLPLMSTQEVLSLDEQLKDTTVFKQMMNHLSLQGGDSLKGCVRRMLAYLIHKDAALKINWLGRNNKMGFQDLVMCKMIKKAVRCNRDYRSSTDQSIEDLIKDWFRYAKDLDGGRKGRNKKQKINEESVESDTEIDIQ